MWLGDRVGQAFQPDKSRGKGRLERLTYAGTFSFGIAAGLCENGAMRSLDSQTEPDPRETLGRYQLLQKLGQGGMGTVYLAVDTKLDRRVAIKILPAHYVNDPAAIARFQREAKALAKLSHAGIIQAHDADHVEDRHFLVMEYVEGVSLTQIIKEKGRLAPLQAADYIYQAALALQHAHEKGLIHRDLKPSNLLVTQDGHIKLLDLGLARFVQDQIGDPELTREGTGMGTPDYAAPEQFRDAHHADVRSDIYSLGCTLYHLLAGQVPFPGSSWQEKYTAHQHREPPPLTELCPEAPLGLVEVVGKMMAKRPRDRFAQAREVAEALAPHVGGTSIIVDSARQTMTWMASRATQPAIVPTKARVGWAMIGACVAAFFLAGGLLAWQVMQTGAGNDTAQIVQQPLPTTPTAKGKDTAEPPPPDTSKDKKDPPKDIAKAAGWDDPDVLTVARDGSARFKTINEALNKAKTGQTIRVLDAGEYQETLTLARAEQFANITLEAIRKAHLVGLPKATFPLLQIINVPGVTVRGFQFRPEPKNDCGIEVSGHCPGTVLEDLAFDGQGTEVIGVRLASTLKLPAEAPVVLRRGAFRKLLAAVEIAGQGRINTGRDVCRGIRVQANHIADCRHGIVAGGHVEQVHLVGNTIIASSVSGIHLQDLQAGTRHILIANNTLLQCQQPIRLWDDEVHGTDIQVCNNLILACGAPADVLWHRTGPDSKKSIGPGDGKQLLKAWRVAHNWRELGGPPAADPWRTAWVPEGANDKVAPRIDVLSRNPKDADFLRPAADAAFAEDGAGQTDPSLPMYVGALPPWGKPAWDWSRTWLAPPPGVLLTVSQDPNDGGQYRTISDALKDAKPWATIRVVDAASYTERLLITSTDQHLGVQLEASRGATLLMPPKIPRGFSIQDVPQVRVRGFKFRTNGPAFEQLLLAVVGRCPGVVLENLDIQSKELCYGIGLLFVTAAEKEPVVVRGCRVQTGFDSVSILGAKKPAPGQTPCGSAVVADNRLGGGNRAIYFSGTSGHVDILGNLVTACTMAGIQFEDPGADTSRVRLAHNTIYDCENGIRLWNNTRDLVTGQVQVRHNLFAKTPSGFATCYVTKAAGRGDPSPDLAAQVATTWKFNRNWRDESLDSVDGTVPLEPLACRKLPLPFVSVDPGHADFLRPTPELFKLMAEAAAPGDLPYLGAVPPPGVEPQGWR
jgi:hypothetical protein